MKLSINSDLIDKGILITDPDIKVHSKASERYVSVEFNLKDGKWFGWIPIEYRRTGINLTREEDIFNHISDIHLIMTNLSIKQWLMVEEDFWNKEKSRSLTTKSFFDILATGGWKCSVCTLPNNRNFARRIQDLKELGYTISTNTKHFCGTCNKHTTGLLMLPIPRVKIAGNGYETWSTSLRKRILKTLSNYDVYEGKKGSNLLPDHKFPEIRWDEFVKSSNPEDMSEKEIKGKFQLMSNQRNQQKREACRTCFQTNKRQYPFGIKFFYTGDENWDASIPIRGSSAIRGCLGCAWYDMETWRKELLKLL